MSRQQTYIVRLLRQVESSTPGQCPSSSENPLAKIIQKISQADDIHQALEMLYAVHGFEDFAIRLMWCLERNGVVYSDPANDVVDYEVGYLNAVLNHSSNGRTLRPTVEAVSQSLDTFYDKLHNFGRAVEEARRKSLQTDETSRIDSEAIYRVISNIEDLKTVSKKTGKERVFHFADSAAMFLQYVIDHDRLNDRRVVHILDHANRTLQTVMEAIGLEEYQSLNEVSAMLRDPEQLLT